MRLKGEEGLQEMRTGVLIRFDDSERDLLEQLARRWEVSLAEAVRRLVRDAPVSSTPPVPKPVAEPQPSAVSSVASPVPKPARNPEAERRAQSKPREAECRVKGAWEPKGKALR